MPPESEFTPELTPQQMLELGVFDGWYFHDGHDDLPDSWFKKAKIAVTKPDPSLNFFAVHASQSQQEWERKGWIFPEDPLGWFQWYCRYYLGRRLPEMDAVQIRRWKAIRRHIGQIQKNCMLGDINCRPRQRQALLHWAYDSRKL